MAQEQRLRQRCTVRLLIVGIVVMSSLPLFGCGGSNSDETKCPDERVVAGVRYSGTTTAVEVEIKIGKAAYTACDDGYGPEISPASTAWSIAGVDPEEAVAVGPRDNSRLFIANSDDDWSPRLKELTKDGHS